MLNATFLCEALVARTSRDGVEVPGGTYLGWRSSLEKLNERAHEAIDFNRPRA